MLCDYFVAISYETVCDVVSDDIISHSGDCVITFCMVILFGLTIFVIRDV